MGSRSTALRSFLIVIVVGLPFYLLVNPASSLSRDAGSDVSLAAANDYPTGIWSDGTTMWVADFEDRRLYAYNVSDGSRAAEDDFRLVADNNLPVGIWSDGVTMWVSDFQDGKLYAYNMSTTARDPGKEFDTLRAAGNYFPEGIWSDGVTMWVVDVGADKAFAYSLSDTTPDAGKSFELGAGHTSPMGIWSDGITMWVSDWRDAKAYAYSAATKARDAGKDFTLDADNSHPEGIWSDGTTMWIADREDDKVEGDKLYAYALPPGVVVFPTSLALAEGGSGAYTLALNAAPTAEVTVGITSGGDVSVSPTSVTFNSSNWSTAQTVTVSAAQDDDAANDAVTLQHSVSTSDSSFSGTTVADVAVNVTDDEHAGVTVSVPALTLTEGGSGDYTLVLDAAPTAEVTIEVAAGGDVSVSPSSVTFGSSNWSTAQTVTVSAAQDDDEIHDFEIVSHSIAGGSAPEFAALTDLASVEVSVDDDTRETSLELAAENRNPAGIWSDGTTMWVTDDIDRKLYGYSMATMARDAGKDFTSLDARNVLASSIWSDGTTMWVAERSVAKLYAYRMSDGGRDAAKDFDTLRAAGNSSPRGIWSDGTTMWVSDSSDEKLYAYNMSTTARDTAKDFDTLDPANNSPQGIWSDGRTTMWVSDPHSDKLYAYSMVTKARDTDYDFDTLRAAGNSSPRGIWSDGTTMWVADPSSDKLYFYEMPASVSAALRTPSRLVANTDQTSGRMVGIHSSNPKIGQGFTTGGWANGYALTSVAVRFDAIGADAALTTEMSATINEGDETDESKPGAALCTLVGPPSYAHGRLNTYTASASGCRLSANTAYFVVLEREYDDVEGAASMVGLGSTVAAAESSGSAAGWSIADYHNYWTHDMWRTEAERIVRIKLAGHLVPNTASADEATASADEDTVPTEEPADAEPVWTTTLTVGTRGGYSGYSVFGNSGLGALSDTKFEVDGTYFDVGYVAVLDGDLIFGLAEVLHSGFVLRVGDQEFASGDAVLSRVGAAYRFHWEDAGLVWSDDDEVPVSLFVGGSDPASVPNPLSGFTVVNAENQKDVASVVDGATLTLAGPDDSSYSIRVDTNAYSAFIRSVRLELSGAKSARRTANSGPYSLYGGGRALIGEGLPVGSYTLRATAYSQQDLGGEVLGTLETSFAVEASEPLTVSVENAATTHDGSAAFTFELRFSENFPLSYVTLRDRAFAVTDGDVLRAQRIDKPSNIGWRITVRPDGNGDVSVVLPVTTDCGTRGAICTQAGTKLSNRLELTVRGPG